MVYKLQSPYSEVQCFALVTLAQNTIILTGAAMASAIGAHGLYIIYKVGLFQDSSVEHLSSGLERYKDLQKYFNRRLKATYRRFSNIPDHSVVRPDVCFGFHFMNVP